MFDGYLLFYDLERHQCLQGTEFFNFSYGKFLNVRRAIFFWFAVLKDAQLKTLGLKPESPEPRLIYSISHRPLGPCLCTSLLHSPASFVYSWPFCSPGISTWFHFWFAMVLMLALIQQLLFSSGTYHYLTRVSVSVPILKRGNIWLAHLHLWIRYPWVRCCLTPTSYHQIGNWGMGFMAGGPLNRVIIQEQRSTNLFYRLLIKQFRLCRSYGLCCNYPTLLLYVTVPK